MTCLTRRVGIGDDVPSKASTGERLAAPRPQRSPRTSQPIDEDGL